MGNCLAFQVSCDQTLNYVCGCLCGDGNYIKNLTQNLDVLEDALEELVARRADFSRSVQLEELKGLRRYAEVELWLSRAEAIENRARRLINDRTKETGRLCMNGYCSKNLCSSYSYGKMVCKMLKDVRELKSNGVFNAVAEIILEPVDQRPIKPTVGLDKKVDEAWNLLMKEEVGTLGLYGMGGVGKTTLLTLLNNKFAEEMNGFDIVIWITVSKNGRIARIQEEIGKRLCIHNDIWVQKEEKEKASDIHKVLKKLKFVLLLDDVWKEIDLQEIGVPYPGQGNHCKIAYTARSKETRGCMSVEAEMDVACLESTDAWDLFQKNVGEITLNSHEDIRKLAEDMAARCGGLPLALNVIGAAMSCKRTVQEWRDAKDYLMSPRHPVIDMTDVVLSILRFSYDDLENDTFKRCFLYCALFPEDYEIEKEELIDYWIAEDLIPEENRESSVNFGYRILGKLVRTCLLIDDESKGVVKMHDLVREMALKVACSEPYNEFNFIVKSGISLHSVPVWKPTWTAVRRISLMGNQIQKAFSSYKSPELLTLFLHNNDFLEMSRQFFYFMPKLVVLNLSRNYNLKWLPDISSLISLRHLDLSHTEIVGLPYGLERLEMLIHLNLEFTMELRNIYGISRLDRLQVLKLLGSRCTFSDALSEIQNLRNLQLLTTSINGDWEAMRCNLARCVQDLSIRMLKLPSITIQVSHNLRYLEIRDSYISEICTDMGNGNSLDLLSFSRGNSRHTCFSKLSRVEIINCGSLRHLTWVMFAPNLTHLRVVRSRQIEEIICKEKISDEQQKVTPFQKLLLLHLQDLGELTQVHWSPLPFPCLTKVVIFGCPKLKKLPLYSESAKGQNLVIDAEKEWVEELEWEDEATKQRFSTS